ncbi:AzlD domain-containing protein [Halomonas halmophila]|uniref:Branched-chain amino acid ABC transporter n=1 Tax=Halomonas halmophila TaxID=252 RepID=A0A4Y4F318_9GAMM|nr:AzlD domain-containing protein [Halomonas halmophila]GED21531.1 hypothetical protein HHA01_05080 [Halomonas halmophila]
MSDTLWLAVLACAIGTYLIRLLPLLWMRRRLKRLDGNDSVEAMPQWLSILGPMMIAALFGVSLVPRQPDTTAWLATLLGVIATLIVWYRLRSLGWPIIAGVGTYGSVILLMDMLQG